MDVINQIINDSAIGLTQAWIKSLVLAVFATIVVSLFTMLIVLLLNAPHMTISFGY